MINKIFQTVLTLGKVVFKSNYFISVKPTLKKDLIVLANAPSLEQDIINNRGIFEKTDLAVVNHFCQSEYFFELKPSHYFMVDPAFFEQPFIEPVEKTFEILISQKVDWEITFYVPWNNRKSFFIQGLLKRKNFKFQFVNYVTTKGGFRAINHWLYNRNLALPQCQNIVVFTLFLATRLGAKRVFLFGAENDWHANVKVNSENFLVHTNLHLYKKEQAEKILMDPANPQKRTTMVSLLESCVKVFKGYEVIEQYAKKKYVQIYNCSKNSLLDSFKRLDDDEFKQMMH